MTLRIRSYAHFAVIISKLHKDQKVADAILGGYVNGKKCRSHTATLRITSRAASASHESRWPIL